MNNSVTTNESPRSPMPLAVISGASSGIGAATALAMAQAGWRVVLVARREDALTAVAQRIHAAGGEALIEALDAADGRAVIAMAERILAQHGTPQVIINSAGAGIWRFVEETTPEQAREMMDAPYHAAFNLTHAFMPALLQRGSGLIVHVNSPASALTWPGATGYAAARWALRGLHEALCQDLAGTKVRSTHVVVGLVRSEYWIHNPDSERHLPAAARIIPPLTPEECAEVILRVVRRPRREVIHPFLLRVFYWAGTIAPPLVRWLGTATGRRHVGLAQQGPGPASPR